MKLKTLLVILAIVAAVAFFWSDIYRDRAKDESLREMEARDKLSASVYAKARKAQAEFEAQKNKEIAVLHGQVDSLNFHIAGLQEKDKKMGAELARIRASWGTLDLVCQGKLKELDGAWTLRWNGSEQEKASLREIIRFKDAEIASNVAIIASLHVALSAADDRIKGLEATVATITGKYIRARNTGYLKTVGIVVITVLAVIA